LPQAQAAQPSADVQRLPRFRQTGFQCDNTDSEEQRANEWAR
jgi:hypothetical protein